MPLMYCANRFRSPVCMGGPSHEAACRDAEHRRQRVHRRGDCTHTGDCGGAEVLARVLWTTVAALLPDTSRQLRACITLVNISHCLRVGARVSPTPTSHLTRRIPYVQRTRAWGPRPGCRKRSDTLKLRLSKCRRSRSGRPSWGCRMLMPTTPSYLGVPYPHTTHTQHIGGARGRRRVSNGQGLTERAWPAHERLARSRTPAPSWRPSRSSVPPRPIRDKAKAQTSH